MTVKKVLYNIITNLMFFLAANVVYLVWQPYPKSIIKTFGSSTFVSDLATNILYAIIISFAVYFFIYEYVCGYPMTMKKGIAIVGVYISFLLISDLIRLSVSFLGRYQWLVTDFLTVITWVICVLIYCRLTERTGIKYIRFFQIVIPASILLLSVSFVLDLSDISMLDKLSLRYLPSSEELSHAVTNTEFFFQFRNMLLETFIIVVALIAVFLSCEQKTDNDKEYKSLSKFKSVRKGMVLFARISLILWGALLGCSIKTILLPGNSIADVHGDGHRSSIHSGMGIEYSRFTFERDAGDEETCVILRTNNYIFKYNGKQIINVTLDGNISAVNMDMKNKYEMQIEGTDVNVWFNYVIEYFKDGVPYVLIADDLSELPYNEVVLSTCKQLLADGMISWYEYAYDYIQRYDSNYIEPYNERYAKGEFNDIEIANAGSLDLNYISLIAQKTQ